MQRREFWERQFKVFPVILQELTVNHLTGFYRSIFTVHNHDHFFYSVTGINIMAKVFANVCFWDVFVIFWMQCFI